MGAEMYVKHIDLVRRFVPRQARYFVQRFVSLSSLKLKYRERLNPYFDVTESLGNTAGSPHVFGIVRDAAQYYSHYVAACLEMGVPFKVVDLAREDWIEHVIASNCGVFLLWPDAFFRSRSEIIKDRVEILENELHKPVFPTSREVWLYEDKARVCYWLRAKSDSASQNLGLL